MQLHFPIMLVLFLPAVAYLVWLHRRNSPQLFLKAAIVGMLVLIAAGPQTLSRNAGKVLILLLDRSGSSAEQTSTLGREIVPRARAEAGDRNRLAVIGFGENAVVEQFLDVAEHREHYELRGDRSNIFGAVRRGLEITPSTATPRFLLVSDGMAHDDLDPELLKELNDRDARVDFIAEKTEVEGDIALTGLVSNVVVTPEEPLHVKARVNAPAPCSVILNCRVESEIVSKQSFELKEGDNLLEWTVSHQWLGVSRVLVELVANGDTYPSNNTWEIVVRSPSGGRTLWISGRARTMVGTNALALDGVQHFEPRSGSITERLLSQFETVVLDNVTLDHLELKEQEALHDYVTRFGGGLCVLGGERSFAAGGFRFSPIDPMLPVSLHPVGLVTHRPVELAVVANIDWDEGAEVLKSTLGMLARHMSPKDSLAFNASLKVGEIEYGLTRGPKPYDVESEISMRQNAGVAFYGGNSSSVSLTGLVTKAVNQLDTVTPSQKHLFIVTDGGQMFEGGWQGIRDPFAGIDLSGLRVTMIVVGMSPDNSQFGGATNAMSYLNRLRSNTSLGPGSTILTTKSLGTLKQTLIRAFQDITRTDYVQGVTPVGVLSRRNATKKLFEVPGMNPSAARETAETLLVNTLDSRLCIAARHGFGAGRVFTFSAPVNKAMSADLASFLKEQMKWSAGTDGSLVNAELSYNGEQMQMRLTDLNESSITLSQSVDQDSEGSSITPNKSGEFVIPITVTDDMAFVRIKGASGTSYRLPPVTMPRSREFITRGGADSGRELLVSLADQTGGMELGFRTPLFDGMETGMMSLTPTLAWFVLLLMIVGNVWTRMGQSSPRIRQKYVESDADAESEAADSECVFEAAKQRTLDRLGG